MKIYIINLISKIMNVENNIKELLTKNPEGISISAISSLSEHTRTTISKYLELMRLKEDVNLREVDKTKLWVNANSRKKILLVDDDASIRKLIRVILGNIKYEIKEAKDGEEAIEMVSELMPELIILDLCIPKIDGYTVCEQVKKNALTRKIPVIILTTRNDVQSKMKGICKGADDSLTKPFDPTDLRIMVNEILKKTMVIVIL